MNPGDVLAGRYRVERVLGEGGMGVVLAAQHLVLGERVAVKLLLPEAAGVEGVVSRFQREARAAARIQSEHVARVMDVGLTDTGTPYLVMEYVEGRDLAAELEARGPLPLEETVGWVLQAMVGVAEAHALGIVHRDLKPSNLFLARLPNGRALVKVLDFGIAKDTKETASKDLTSTFSALGSAAYMSPEQLRLAKSVDARTDVWAFGVVLFELLTARMPFEGESVTALAAAITVDQPIRLRSIRPDLPPELEAIILRCLEKNRDQRTASLAVLADEIAPFGGRSAAMLVERIVQALGHAPAAVSTAVRPPLDSEPIAISRSAGTKTVASMLVGRRALVVGGAAAMIALVALGWALSRDRAPAGATAESKPATTALAAEPQPMPAATNTASASPMVSPEHSAEPAPAVSLAAPSATAQPKTPRRNPVSGDRRPGTKPVSRKPIVKDL